MFGNMNFFNKRQEAPKAPSIEDIDLKKVLEGDDQDVDVIEESKNKELAINPVKTDKADDLSEDLKKEYILNYEGLEKPAYDLEKEEVA